MDIASTEPGAKSDGTALERYSYSPYGQVTFVNASFGSIGYSPIGNQHLYTGREQDPETGLQLNRRRYYASHFGRWLTRDPIGYLAGTNLYQFCSSNPTNRTDFLGESEIQDHIDNQRRGRAKCQQDCTPLCLKGPTSEYADCMAKCYKDCDRKFPDADSMVGNDNCSVNPGPCQKEAAAAAASGAACAMTQAAKPTPVGIVISIAGDYICDKADADRAALLDCLQRKGTR